MSYSYENFRIIEVINLKCNFFMQLIFKCKRYVLCIFGPIFFIEKLIYLLHLMNVFAYSCKISNLFMIINKGDRQVIMFI